MKCVLYVQKLCGVCFVCSRIYCSIVHCIMIYYFLLLNFNFANASIQIIDCVVSNSSTNLDTLENYWISTLCTAYPLGLNDRLDSIGNISKLCMDNSHCYFNKPITRRKRGHGRRKKDKRVIVT